ncbi:GntR family transcriptional regulator [Pseudactinotalea sp. Z1748]|uniref:GntR family transcriptional regulator n=1 Tax=Pseudactinotalea sp. Z1748 TaxID=3413027 RepID=UPI003C7CA96C
MTGLVAVSKSEMVYQRVRDRILTGTYGAGYRLVLDKLAREFEVSPVPVREAIRRLEAEGLVTFTRNVGAEVSGVNERDYTDAMQTLAYLESAATALAVPALSAEQVAEATEVNEQMRHLHHGDFDPVRFTALNERFHRVLCGACPNQRLLDLVDREWQRMAMIRRSSFIRLSSRPAVSIAEHDDLLHLIRTKAPAGDVEQAARAHKLRTMEEFLAGRNGGT